MADITRTLTAIEALTRKLSSISDGVKAILEDINSKDFATETTLQNIDNKDFATEVTLESINNKDFATETTLDSLLTTELISNWGSNIGEVITFTYYTGVAAGNPSGNKNIQTKVLSNGTGTILTFTYTYDSADDLLTTTTT